MSDEAGIPTETFSLTIFDPFGTEDPPFLDRVIAIFPLVGERVCIGFNALTIFLRIALRPGRLAIDSGEWRSRLDGPLSKSRRAGALGWDRPT